MDVCFQFPLGAEWPGNMVTLYLTFWEADELLSIGVAPFYVPTSMYEGSNFSVFSPTLGIAHLFYFCHPCVYAVVYPCAYDMHFPND